MSNAKNINEVSVITSVDSGDYVMVSDISDDSLKRATVTNVGKTLLGTTDISAIGDGSVTGAISDLDTTKLDIAGGTMTGNLTVNNTSNNPKVIIGSADNTRAGILQTYSDNGYCTYLYPLTLTANRQLKFPDADGTLALASDIITSSNGYVVGTQNASVTIPTATLTTIGTVTLPSAGIWLVLCHLLLPETSGTKGIGSRAAWIETNETVLPANRYIIDAPNNTTGSGIKIENLINATANTTVYFRAYQNSGSNMSTSSNGVYAAKLMNS